MSPTADSDACATARERMVREQLEGRGITDPRVLAAMRRVERHRFVSEQDHDAAYADRPLPIGAQQTISQPYMVAVMTQALELTGGERVLEVGTGSGYQTAILAELGTEVFTIERVPELAERARDLLRALGYARVTVRAGDGSLGWPEMAPFRAILVTAGAPRVPLPLREQLGEGGRLVVPVGSPASQVLRRVIRHGSQFVEEDLLGCVFVRLVGEQGWQG